MGNMTPRDFSLPVERIAQRLLATARDCPELISRNCQTAGILAERPSPLPTPELGPFPQMALLSDPALDIRHYLEDLVSIAISSAQQAEDVSLHAREATRKARRGMVVIGCLGALGLAVGVAGLATAQSSDAQLAQVRKEVGALKDMQLEAHDQLNEAEANVAAEGYEARPMQRAGTIRPQATSPTVPAPTELIWKSRVHYSTPWPDSRPVVPAPPRRVTPPAQTHQVVVPRFFAALQQNIRALFR